MEQATQRPYKVDFNAYREEKEEKRVKPGTYPGKITNVTMRQSRAGNPMFVWDATLTDSQHAGENFKLYTPVQDNMMWKLEETFTAVGLTDEDGNALSGEWVPEDVIGTKIGCVIKEEEYNNELRANLDKFVSHYDTDDEIGSDLPF